MQLLNKVSITLTVAILSGCSGDVTTVRVDGCEEPTGSTSAGAGGAELGGSGGAAAGSSGASGATQRTTEELCGSVDFPVVVQLSHPEFMTGCLQRKPTGMEWCCPHPRLPDVGVCGDGFTTGDEECDGQRFCNPNCKWMTDAEVIRCGGPMFIFTYAFSTPEHLNNCIETTAGGLGWCCRNETQPD